MSFKVLLSQLSLCSMNCMDVGNMAVLTSFLG